MGYNSNNEKEQSFRQMTINRIAQPQQDLIKLLAFIILI